MIIFAFIFFAVLLAILLVTYITMHYKAHKDPLPWEFGYDAVREERALKEARERKVSGNDDGSKTNYHFEIAGIDGHLPK